MQAVYDGADGGDQQRPNYQSGLEVAPQPNPKFYVEPQPAAFAGPSAPPRPICGLRRSTFLLVLLLAVVVVAAAVGGGVGGSIAVNNAKK